MHLELKNFRSHAKYSADFGQTTIIIGPNGAGKTNILEAISFISAARSFRADDKKSLIKDGADFATIKLDNLETIIAREPRLVVTFKKNGVKKRLSEFIGVLPSAVFTPQSLQLLIGPPVERRRYLDILLSQTDKEYLKALLEYRKIISRRNRLLQQIREQRTAEDQLDFWDEKLLATARTLVSGRQSYINFLIGKLADYYKMFDGEACLTLNYHRSPNEFTEESIRQKRGQEIMAGNTLYGPHRDDLEIIINNHQAANYASRGEIRGLVISLKLAEADYLLSSQNYRASSPPVKPILLLDDVFSELDESHRAMIDRLVENYQTIITTTDLDHLSSGLKRNADIITLG